MAKEKTQNKIHIKNKRVSFEYFIIDTYTAGIVLTGTEIKSIREGKASLSDSYCTFKNNDYNSKNKKIAKKGRFSPLITKKQRVSEGLSDTLKYFYIYKLTI